MDIISKVPSSVRYDKIKLNVYAETADGNPYADVWLEYERPETEKETKERELREENQKKWDEQRERGTLKYLYEKYGKPE